jgi:hypothetical protein
VPAGQVKTVLDKHGKAHLSAKVQLVHRYRCSRRVATADILHTLFIVSEVETTSSPLTPSTSDARFSYEAEMFSSGGCI